MNKIVLKALIMVILILNGCISPLDTNTTTTPKEETSTIDTNNDDSWYRPKQGTTWQWQLSGTINTDYTVDLYDIDLSETPQTVIDELHSRDINVICYFSAGSVENYREDAKDFPDEVIGKPLENWPDEKWLDISHYALFADSIKKRLDLAMQKGCDGVEPDNSDGYQNDTGFDLTYEDQLNYNKWLAEEAHKRNLSIALKNDLEQVDDLVNYFDFAINEHCFYYDECEKLLPFIEQDKAVLGVEYELDPNEFCEEANRLNFSWLKMNDTLDGRRLSCK
ncbi:endo alpha-1,4 polygalactosaminidase [Patescibacteria group bacterium]|nr:endo alpha-1,4 polygalactosaminidase [Patescibacteria group bacterium]